MPSKSQNNKERYIPINNLNNNSVNLNRNNNNQLDEIVFNNMSHEIEYYRIPKFKNILHLIDSIHSNILHQGENKIFEKIKELKIYYKGI